MATPLKHAASATWGRSRERPSEPSGGLSPSPPEPASSPAAHPPPPVLEMYPAPSLLKEVLLLLGKIAVIGLVFLLIFTFMFGLYRNVDADMAPAVKDGDLVIFYRLDKRYVAQDTLVLLFQGKRQVRRVVATAGDTVDITPDGLLVNGAIQQEPDIFFPTQRYEDGTVFPLTLQEGQVFVLGDHRTNATDSRVYGVVSVEDTLGKVMTLLRRRHI